jgi:uncharacterized protein
VSHIRRVVLDTSTLVSAALRIGSVPHQALLKALSSCDVCASADTLAELQDVLSRKKFDRYLDRESRLGFVALMRRHVNLYAVEDAEMEAALPPCRDPKDTKFLALALAAEADVLVSSDDDLLVVHPWQGIPIITARDFLAAGSSR